MRLPTGVGAFPVINASFMSTLLPVQVSLFHGTSCGWCETCCNYLLFAIRIASYSDSLVDLDLSTNKLTSLPGEFSCLTKLKFVNISNNMLSELSLQFKSWKALQQISFSSNRFLTVPTFLYEIESLETILATSNQITEIDVSGLERLPKLANLDLSNNNIQSVPPELGKITTLKSLQLEGNSFRNPRHAILTKGTAHLLEYLRDRIPR